MLLFMHYDTTTKINNKYTPLKKDKKGNDNLLF